MAAKVGCWDQELGEPCSCCVSSRSKAFDEDLRVDLAPPSTTLDPADRVFPCMVVGETVFLSLDPRFSDELCESLENVRPFSHRALGASDLGTSERSGSACLASLCSGLKVKRPRLEAMFLPLGGSLRVSDFGKGCFW